jgi:NADPH:quinone reductase-like Zn-dependent oxidoreductase
MARVITFAQHGGPEGFEYTEVGTPEPAADEVRIRVLERNEHFGRIVLSV